MTPLGGGPGGLRRESRRILQDEDGSGPQRDQGEESAEELPERLGENARAPDQEHESCQRREAHQKVDESGQSELVAGIVQRPEDRESDRSHHREHGQGKEVTAQGLLIGSESGRDQRDDQAGEKGRHQAQRDQDESELAQSRPDEPELARDSFNRSDLRQSHEDKTVDSAHEHGAEERGERLRDQVTVLGDARAEVSGRQDAARQSENHQEAAGEGDRRGRQERAGRRTSRPNAFGIGRGAAGVFAAQGHLNGPGSGLGRCHRGIERSSLCAATDPARVRA